MAGRGWLNLESATNLVPENQMFENESAFKWLGLTRTQRLWGFIICAVVGFVLSILGSILLFLPGGLLTFAFLYAVGIIVSHRNWVLDRQLKLMFKPVRIVATVVFLGLLAGIFVVAFVLGNELLCLILVVVEYLAYTWYSLSYIPYARTAILKMIGMG
ncbi:SFT2-domain-containing protein [Auriculariales sp. MPI-PUGE-AT-0066]|nr:SFT2-domain-containing protein [Auriculariales sp. MPI-PUGE-AT-0066]